MLTWDIFTHYLFSKRSGALVRTIAWLCTVGIGVSVAALIIVLSVMASFNTSIKDRLLAVEPHLVVRPDKATVSEILEFLDTANGVTAYKYETQDVIVRTLGGQFGGAVAKGIEPGPLTAMLQRVEERRSRRNTHLDPLMLTEQAGSLEAGEIMMGEELSRSLGVFEGDEVVLIPPEALLLPAGETPTYERVRVSSLLVTEVPEVDSKMVFFGLNKGLRVFGDAASREQGVEVRLLNPDDYDVWDRKLTAMGARVSTWVDRNASLFYALRLEKFMMTTFLSLSALITSFSILTVLVLLIIQKRQDIGALMSMGLSPTKARSVFVRVGMMLSGIGVGSGLLIGLSVSLILHFFPLNVLPDIYYDSTIGADVEPLTVTIVAVTAFSIAFLGAWVPVSLSIKMTPAEALRGQKG